VRYLIFIVILLNLALQACQTPGSLYKIRGDCFVIESSEMQPKALNIFAEDIDLIFKNYKRLFRLNSVDLQNLTIHLNDQSEIFDTDEFPALYQVSNRSIRFYRKPDHMLLLHEIAHHFIRHSLGSVPVWLNEGMATYLGWSAMDGERIITGEIPVVHYKAMKKLLEQNKLIPLNEFLELSQEEFYKEDLNALHYSQAWGVVFFLFQEHMQDKIAFFDKLELLSDLSQEAIRRLDGEFREFWKSFSASKMMVERLGSSNYLSRLSSAYRLGLLQEEGSVGPLLKIARNKSKDAYLRVVSLYSVAMITLGAGNSEVKSDLMYTIERIENHPSQRIKDGAKYLKEAFKSGNKEAITKRFGEIGRMGGFYPAGRFTVVKTKEANRESDL